MVLAGPRKACRSKQLGSVVVVVVVVAVVVVNSPGTAGREPENQQTGGIRKGGSGERGGIKELQKVK